MAIGFVICKVHKLKEAVAQDTLMGLGYAPPTALIPRLFGHFIHWLPEPVGG